MPTKPKQPETVFSARRGEDALPAVGEGPSLVVSEGRIFATPEQLENMEKYVTPEMKARTSAFAKRVASLQAPTSTASTFQLIPFTPPSVPIDAVKTIQKQAEELFENGYTVGSRNEATLRAERDQAVQRANESAKALINIQAQFDLLQSIMQDMVISGKIQTHEVAGGPRGPPPPRANASHGAASGAGQPGWLDGDA
jgi:hypothetical protein